MAYATVDHLKLCFDERLLADLCRDDGVSETNLSSNEAVESALERGASDINSAVLVGKMYRLEDLEDLTGTDAWILRELNCELAVLRLIRRRVWESKYGTLREDLKKGTEAYLDRIRQGDRVFNIDRNIDAGVASHDGLTRQEYHDQNWGSRTRYNGFYPAIQLPVGRG